jgi:hypothetical protein
MGFKRRLLDFLDLEDVEKILELIPEGVVLPLFYKGDSAKLKNGEEVIILDTGYKNREYIYYYDFEGEKLYSYESDFIIE